MIADGVTGAIVDNLDPNDLAAVIGRTLADDGIYAEVERRADEVAQRFTWDHAAEKVIDIVGAHL